MTRLAVSNIAWPQHNETEVISVLKKMGVSGIEIAPTTIWPRPDQCAKGEGRRLRDKWAGLGFEVVAFQALLFGRTDLSLFESADNRQKMFEYLSRIASLAGELGDIKLVFGSPKNRRRGDMAPEAATSIAASFFKNLADKASDEGVTFCLEANPPDYGSDYIVNAFEAIDIVNRVDHPGFRLHLDTACMHMAGDTLSDVLYRGSAILGHFHASEPHLSDIKNGIIDHHGASGILLSAGYRGWVSLEMRKADPFLIEELSMSIKAFVSWYS